MAPLFTIGHGTRSLEEFLQTLRDAGIRRLIDVRRFPGSRRHPHFSRAALQHSLHEAGLGYEWRGEELGGRRRPLENSRHRAWRNASFRAYADHMDTPEFRAALDELLIEATTEKISVMCAETLWWRCHRRLIADAAVLRGSQVIHLLSPASSQEHVVTRQARASEDGWPVYADVSHDRLWS